MKNILVFAGHNHSTRGGASDFVSSFDSVFAAKNYIAQHDVLETLMDTLPGIQWVHLFNAEENRIVESGTIEIWNKSDIGNSDDPYTTFTWTPVDDEKYHQPLLVQAKHDADVKAKQEAEEAAKLAAEAAKIQDIEDSLQQTEIKIYNYDLKDIGGSILDGINARLEFAYNLQGMIQEGEITSRHVSVLSITFSDEDIAYLQSIGGVGAPNHWVQEVKKHFSDEDTLELFKNSVITPDEVAQITA